MTQRPYQFRVCVVHLKMNDIRLDDILYMIALESCFLGERGQACSSPLHYVICKNLIIEILVCHLVKLTLASAFIKK